MKRCFLFWLTLLFSTGVWAVTYTVNISSSDNDLGYVTVDISQPGDVDEETYYDTDGTGEVEFEVAKNRTLTLNVYVNDNALYYFAGWSDGKTETTRTVKVTKDLNLTANFEAYPTYTICVEANIDGAGTVDVDGELCESDLREGDKVWLYAEAEDGYVFLRWEDDGPDYDKTSRQVTVTNTDMTYKAIFEEIPSYTVRLSANDFDLGYVYAYVENEDAEYSSDESKSVVEFTVKEGTQIQISANAYIGTYDEFRVKSVKWMYTKSQDNPYEYASYSDAGIWAYDQSGIPTYYRQAYFDIMVNEDLDFTAIFEEFNYYDVHIAANDYDLGHVAVDVYKDQDKNGYNITEGYDNEETKTDINIRVREDARIEVYAYAYDGTYDDFRVKNIMWADSYGPYSDSYGRPYYSSDGGSYFDKNGIPVYYRSAYFDRNVNSDLDFTATFEEYNYYDVHIAANDYDLGHVAVDVYKDQDKNGYNITEGYDNEETKTDINIRVREDARIEVYAYAYDGTYDDFRVKNITWADSYGPYSDSYGRPYYSSDEGSYFDKNGIPVYYRSAYFDRNVNSDLDFTATFEEYNYYDVHIAANDYDLGYVYVTVYKDQDKNGNDITDDYDNSETKKDIDIRVREDAKISVEADAYEKTFEEFLVKSIKWTDAQSNEYPANRDPFPDSYEGDDGTYYGYIQGYDLNVNSDMDLIAVFETYNFYNIHIAANDYDLGSVSVRVNTTLNGNTVTEEYDTEETKTNLNIRVREDADVFVQADAYRGYYDEFLVESIYFTDAQSNVYPSSSYSGYDNYGRLYYYNYSNFETRATSDLYITAHFEKFTFHTVHLASNNYDWGNVNVGVYTGTDVVDRYISDNKDALDVAVRDGDQIVIGAETDSPNFIELAQWSDGNTDVERTLYVGNAIDLTAEFKEKEHPTPETGYTQLGNSKLYYGLGQYSVDIHGLYNRRYYQSTYGNSGYYAAIKVGENSAQMIPGSGTASYNGVQVETSIQQQNKYARIIYTVTNSSNAAKTVSLGAYADVQIGENDSAPIKTRSVSGNVFGLTMDDGTGSQFCVLFGAGISGVAPVSDYWFGSYNQNSNAEEIVGNYTAGDNYMEENGSYDSGMGWCWKNRTIGAGETMVFSYLLAVGDISIEPNSNITVTPNDMSKWNDITAVQSLFVEGTYDGVLNGTVEYRVEDSEEWLTLAENIPSGEVFYKSINVQFDATKMSHLLRFRTRDIMGNISGETTFAYQDINSYGVTGGIENKVYTGDPIEQTGLTSDLADESLYQYTYIDNVNAGTATLYFEGVFPYSIGRKVYTFKIEPQQLTGTISPNTSSRTYTGSEIKTGWHFSNEAYYGTHALQADKDFTATYTNNILPGIATITVTGKGNYKGTLTTTFEIKKMQLESSLWEVTLPDDNILYDGQKHGASVTTNVEGIGTAQVITINRETGAAAEPIEKGIYDMYIRIAEGALYYGTDEDLYVGTTTIYELDDTDWAALQNIYNELITRGWNNPWDMSKGKAGIASMVGITLTQGHVTGLDLSNSNLTGTFPTSVLYLPYLETLDLSGNQLSGDIEDGLDAYTAWAAEQQTDEKETIDIYVQKPTSWSSARIWAWTGYGNTTHNLFDEWPGVEMTETANGWWKYSGLPKGVSVVLNDYYHTGEKSMDIPDNGQGGGLQGDTWIVMSNEMVNNSGFGYGYAANWWSDPTKGLRHINIANNAFTGNIGAFAALFPELVTLDAQQNRIEEVAPMISTKITSLNVKNQAIATTRTIDMRKSQTMSDLMALIPSVMTYNHTAQTYSLNGTLKIENSLTEPTWDAQLTVSNGQVTLASATGNEFRFGAEDVLYAVESSTGSSFPVSILFNEGDANFDGAVDVIDLQTMINHIFGKNSASRPFNFTAANLYKDEVINIQDIVLQVNLLLQAQAEEQSVGRRMTPADEHTEAATARLTWRNGELHLFSEEPVASMDLTINSESGIEWQIPSHTVRSVDSGQNHKAIVYSLGGKTLPAGTDIVIARSKTVTVETVSATLSNSDAERIPVQLLTEYVGVPTATDDVEGAEIHVSVVNNTVVLTTDEPLQNANWTLYDFTGKAITGGVVNTTGGTSQLTSGIPTGTYMFVLREQTGKVINIQKTILK